MKYESGDWNHQSSTSDSKSRSFNTETNELRVLSSQPSAAESPCPIQVPSSVPADLCRLPALSIVDEKSKTQPVLADSSSWSLENWLSKIAKNEKQLDAQFELAMGPPPEESLRDGDIVFQSNRGGQGLAVQLATESPLTHTGILFKEGNDWWVYEAVQPVRKTPLKDFAVNGDDGSYVVRRLKNAEEVLTDDTLEKMKTYLNSNLGKNYDSKFEWSDDKIYCSELVWKAYYEATGLEVGDLKKVSEYDLSSSEVKAKIAERYGSNINYNELTIGPGGIYESDLLTTVH